jgi:hypothetical protein
LHPKGVPQAKTPEDCGDDGQVFYFHNQGPVGNPVVVYLWRSTKLTRVCSAKLTQALRADARFFLPRSRGRAVTGALGVGGPEKVPVSQARHGRAVFVKRGPSITESALSAKALVFCNQDRGAF